MTDHIRWVSSLTGCSKVSWGFASLRKTISCAWLIPGFCLINSVSAFSVYAADVGLRGDLIKAEYLGAQSAKSLDLSKRALKTSRLPLSRVREVRFYRLTYRTPALDGHLSAASGLVIVPILPDPAVAVPTVSYQHGTAYSKDAVPSAGTAQPDALAGAIAFASLGEFVVAADYLGLGKSEGMHPYLHVETEASATGDCLLAAQSLAKREKVPLNGKLFLVGVSQGGHATMALQRSLESHPIAGFSIVASAPISGPYDLSGTMVRSLLMAPASRMNTLHAAYLFAAFNEVYDLYGDVSKVVQKPALLALLDGNHTHEELSKVFPEKMTDFFQPEFLRSLRVNDPKNPQPLVEALRKNDIYDWKPVAPVRLFHSKGDDAVAFHNSEVALEAMQKRGAKVELVKLRDRLTHAESMIPGLVAASLWFEELR